VEDSRVSIVSLAHLLVVEMPSGSHFRIVFEIRQDLVNVTESQPGDGIGGTIARYANESHPGFFLREGSVRASCCRTERHRQNRR